MTPEEVAHNLVSPLLRGLPRERHVHVSPCIIVQLRTKDGPSPLLGNPPHFTAKLTVKVRQRNFADCIWRTNYMTMDESFIVRKLRELLPWADQIVAKRTLEQLG